MVEAENSLAPVVVVEILQVGAGSSLELAGEVILQVVEVNSPELEEVGI